MIETYEIYEGNLAGLRAEIEKLNRRAIRLGVAPITLTVGGVVRSVELKNEYTGIVTHVRRYIAVEVSGESPKFNGWNLAAVVEHTPEGNILRKTPDCKLELSVYRNQAPCCQHCNLERRRSETFIVAHDDGALKLVGRDCIKNFLGHKDPHSLAKLAEIAYSLTELCEGSAEEGFFEGGGSSSHLLLVSTFLSFVACAVRKHGYVTGKAAHEDCTVTSTRNRALSWMKPSPSMVRNVDYFTPEPFDSDRAETAKAFVLDSLSARPTESLSDFEHNLLTVAKCEAIDPKSSGICAYIVEYYSRETEKRVKSEAAKATGAASTYFGEAGKRYKGVKLTFLRSTGWDSQYGYTFLHSFVGPAGEVCVWKTGTEIDWAAGSSAPVTFTVKEHSEYKGTKQTVITRAVVS